MSHLCMPAVAFAGACIFVFVALMAIVALIVYRIRTRRARRAAFELGREMAHFIEWAQELADDPEIADPATLIAAYRDEASS